MQAVEHSLPTRSRDELRLIGIRYFRFRTMVHMTRLWPQIRGFAGCEKVGVDGLHHLDTALEAGNGAILVTAHFGHARLIKPLLRSLGRESLLVGPTGSAAPDIPPLFTRFGNLVHTRLLRLPRASRRHARWMRTVGEDLPIGLNVRPHLAALQRNRTLIILTEGRAATMHWHVPVLGIEVPFAPGALRLARKAGAAALPTFVVDDPQRPEPAGLRLVIHPPLELQLTEDANADLETNLRRFASVYETQVRTHPHNWHWAWVERGEFGRPR